MPTLLVIDDDPEILAQVAHVLRNEPYRVLGTTDPAEGLRLVEAERPALVLLDINLGELDGYAVLEQILVQASAGAYEVRVLMLTGRSALEDVRIALEKGARDYLIKPVDAAFLLSRVAEYIVP